MKILVICFLLVKFGEGDIEITAVYDSGDPYTCLEGNRNISITCTVIGSYKSTVKWKKGVLLQATCSNANDNTCLNPPGYNEPRYSFSSSVLAKEFTFRISTTDVDADNGTYICEHGTEISNFDIEVCVPTTTEPPPTTTQPPCRLYVCYIGVYVAVLSAVVILVVYFIVRCLFEILCGVDFFVKIVLPSCCCMLICIVCVVAICIPVEPDCDAGVGIAVPIVIVIILHPCVTAGVIVCHIKCCMVVGASDEDGDKQNKIKKDENLTTNQKNGDPTDRHKKVQASHL